MQAKIKKVELRNLAFEDYKQLKNSMVESYPEMADSYWRANQIETVIGNFSRRTIGDFGRRKSGGLCHVLDC